VRVCVYGAGAVGGSLAVRLSRAGAEVCVIARGEHAAAIRRSGLTLLTGGERYTVRLPCAEQPSEIAPQDAVFVTVKGPQLAAVAESCPALLAPGGRLIFAMNGVPWWFGAPLPDGFVERLDPNRALRRLKPGEIIGAVIYSSNEVTAPGVVENSTPQRNRILLGKPDGGDDAQLDTLVRLLQRAGYDAAATRSIRKELWRKMLLVVGASPVAALTGRDLRALVQDDAARELMATLMREGLALGRRLGFELADDVDQQLAFYFDTPARPSLLQDFEARRPPELDNGILAFCALAAAAGVKLPAMETVAALIRMKIKGAVS
jgi:2-dehydropantoate 2-reductase